MFSQDRLRGTFMLPEKELGVNYYFSQIRRGHWDFLRRTLAGMKQWHAVQISNNGSLTSHSLQCDLR